MPATMGVGTSGSSVCHWSSRSVPAGLSQGSLSRSFSASAAFWSRIWTAVTFGFVFVSPPVNSVKRLLVTMRFPEVLPVAISLTLTS